MELPLLPPAHGGKRPRRCSPLEPSRPGARNRRLAGNLVDPVQRCVNIESLPMKPNTWCALMLLGSLGLFTGSVRQQAPPQPTAAQAEFFETKVRPLLAENCFGCHGKDLDLAHLRLDSREALLKGGDSGPAIAPGDPDKSLLIVAVRQTGKVKMPQGRQKLTEDQIRDLEEWVRMGAPWPSGADSGSKKLWSLKPLSKPPLPKVKTAKWVRNPLDRFVLARLESAGLKPAPEADRRTLIRRLTFDLIGLPPTPAEVRAFERDKSPDAYEKVVDRLLASPRYGERWARRWMDVARYADTKGYVFEEDRNYPNAYTYRDWLIEAFNKDLSYDRFIQQQIAADLLPEVQASDDKRPLAALGFLNVGRRFLNNQADIIDDRIDVTMRGFQAFTVECARCHDHKFDPIPTQDYYSLYGVFNSSQEVTSPISERSIREPWEQYNARVTSLEAKGRDLVLSQIRSLRKKEDAPPAVKAALQLLREDQFPDAEKMKQLLPAFEATAQEELEQNQQELEALRQKAPPTPEFAMAMRDAPNPGDVRVFKRGNPGNPGEVAPRRFLSALSQPGEEREHWTQGSGRLQLAKAIASKSNPLTARVFVNRIWQDHFGAGIVRTPSDFGVRSEPPTDPLLLDYLASSFMEGGWSIKKLHRLIVTSATYRQSSKASGSTIAKDPENRLWSRVNRRRLDLEQMRDAILFASGRLDTSTVGGKSVDLWSEPFSRRRAVYGFIERQNLPGIFRTFDLASPDSTSGRRFMTTVPQQALFFMNSAFAIEQAQALAGRPEIVGAAEVSAKIRSLYAILFGREPTKSELSEAVAYLRQSGGRELVGAPAPAWRYGFGEYLPEAGRVRSFTPLAFRDGSYRGGTEYPDPKLGWVMLNAQGGHPGHDGGHAAIRRWVAPAQGVVQIEGRLAHLQAQGDGVRARIVSSRQGLLGEWTVHKLQAQTEARDVKVEKGDTIDFVVDPLSEESFDGFSWAPVIQMGSQRWDARQEFGPPPPRPLSRIELYAQALLMTNEFLFLD